MKRLAVCIVLAGVALAIIGCSSAPKQAVIEEKELTVDELIARAEKRLEQLEEDQEECKAIIRNNLKMVEGAKQALAGDELNSYLEKQANEIEFRTKRIQELEEQIQEQRKFLEKLKAQM